MNQQKLKEEKINNLQKELLITQEIYDMMQDNDPKKKPCSEYIEKLKLILEEIE